MITWLKINFGQWPDHVHPPNKFLRCHVSTFLTGQNKEKKLTLDSLQAQNYQLLGLVVAEPFEQFKSSLNRLNRVQKWLNRQKGSKGSQR